MELRSFPPILYTIINILIIIGHVISIQYDLMNIADISNCALILPNRNQYNAHLFGSVAGSTIVEGTGDSCITYESINRAYYKEIQRIQIPAPSESTFLIEDEWTTQDVAAIGQLLLSISQQLAKEYNLNFEDIQFGLPQINTSRTDISAICPVFLSSISCTAGKYRRQDGLCNNIQHPSWTSTNTPFTRLLPPQFADNVSSPRKSVTGHELPNPRIVSSNVHADKGYHDHAGTLIIVAWGQFMDHDFMHTATPIDFRNGNEPGECCNRPDVLKNPYCMEIGVAEGDPFYAKYNVKCQDYVRAFPGLQPDCRLGPRIPFNTMTSVIDGNTIYGVTDNISRKLRTWQGGLLEVKPIFYSSGLKDLLAMKTDIPNEDCVKTNGSQFCSLADEARVNEPLILTCIHTLMVREHNRIAYELAALNPHWDDEILYQESRRIVVAEIQHITFNEFLPVILGQKPIAQYDLITNHNGFWDGYSSDVNGGILDAFTAVAYRFGNSLLSSSVDTLTSKKLSELIIKPYDMYKTGAIDEYFMGLLNQVAESVDESATREVTNNLFQKSGHNFDLDMVALNIQRGRDFGLPSYMYFRKHCGLSTADSFAEMYSMMPNSTIHKYMTTYESPWDIDLWSGGVSEFPLPGSLLGPTFACIIATQMNLLRRGDRFWYELPNQPSSFTSAQLLELKKVKLSRIICDNTDLLDMVQLHAMVLPDHHVNPRVACKSSIIPKLDLSHWKDSPTYSPHQRDFPYIQNTTDTYKINHKLTPVYEYHVKTMAIIGGSDTIDFNSLLTVPNKDDDDPTETSPMYEEVNLRQKRELTKGDGIPASSRDVNSYSPPRPRMTQAIMRNQLKSLHSGHSISDDDANAESFFRKNVPIYDGIRGRSIGTNNKKVELKSFNRKPFGSQKEQEDEEDKEPMSLEEVDPDHESQYEEVAMVTRGNKQKLMDDQSFSSKFSPNSPKFESKFKNTNHRTNQLSSGFKSPSFHQQQSSRTNFNRSPQRHSSLQNPSTSSSKFGTSHQFNSLTDNKPRYYEHFVSSPAEGLSQYSSSTYEEKSLPSDSSDAQEPSNYDISDSLYRPTNTPLTIEEYHKVHEQQSPLPTTKSWFSGGGGSSHSPGNIIVPQDDEKDIEKSDEKGDEEDEDDKDIKEDSEDEFPSSKPFVTMNFQDFNIDNGFSVKHHIGSGARSGSRFGSAAGSSKRFPDRPFGTNKKFDRGEESDNTFPNVVPGDSVSGKPKFEDPKVIKEFVTSLFTKGRKPATEKTDISSQFNPNFGERVRGSTSRTSPPVTNNFWNTRSNNFQPSSYNGRTGSRNFKNNVLDRGVISLDRETRLLNKVNRDLQNVDRPSKRQTVPVTYTDESSQDASNISNDYENESVEDPETNASSNEMINNSDVTEEQSSQENVDHSESTEEYGSTTLTPLDQSKMETDESSNAED